ncbi:hypothetical protein CHUV2995_01578 [Corynebacterium diphtheriae subsp. lausannense]|nr:hypothetical protein CHUV2995_01578 [Corynebacterium diphtheriae subsp. lausannense]
MERIHNQTLRMRCGVEILHELTLSMRREYGEQFAPHY